MTMRQKPAAPEWANSAEKPSTLAGQPALAELFAQYLTRAEHAAGGIATGAVEPYDAVALQPVDSAVAWRCARAVLTLYQSYVETRESTADDPVRPENAFLQIRHVHGAAHALADAGLLTPDLGHHGVGIAPLAEEMAVTTMRTGDPVRLLQLHAHAGGDRLLPDVQVDRAR